MVVSTYRVNIDMNTCIYSLIIPKLGFEGALQRPKTKF